MIQNVTANHRKKMLQWRFVQFIFDAAGDFSWAA
jgi:hypothetical protein